MIRVLLFTSAFLVSSMSLGKNMDCSKHRFYCAIIKAYPKTKDAMKLSNSMYKWSKHYGIDNYINPLTSVAIMKQESYMGHYKNRLQKVLIKDADGHYQVIKGIGDISVWQFSIDTMEHYNMDPELLQTDIDYATQQHFRVMLNKLVSGCAKKYPETPWACYHSSTERYHKKYVQDVGMHLDQLKKEMYWSR